MPTMTDILDELEKHTAAAVDAIQKSVARIRAQMIGYTLPDDVKPAPHQVATTTAPPIFIADVLKLEGPNPHQTETNPATDYTAPKE